MNTSTNRFLYETAREIHKGNPVSTGDSTRDDSFDTQSISCWLMQAWTCGSIDEKEDAFIRVLDLDPDNAVAQSGLEWISGFSTVVQELVREADEAESLRLEEEAEAQRLADEAETQRLAEEAEAKRRAEEEAETQRQAEEAEAQRLAEEEAKAEAEAERQAEEEEAQRQADEEAEAKRLAEEEAKAEAEAERQAEEEEAQRQADEEAEAEAERQAEEEAKAEAEAERQAEEEEAQRQADEEAEAQRLAEEEEAAAEAQRQADEEAEFRLLEEQEAAAELDVCEIAESEIQEEIESLQADISTVTTDAAVAQDVAAEDKPASPVVDKDKPLVLAVDDSPTIRKLVTMTLTREGFEVITAADGLEALQLLSDHMPDIILSDVNMPRLDGYKLCRFVKKHERTRHIPVVMLSGKDGVFDKLRGKMFGCGDYITKPFESNDLVEKVRLHTGVHA